MGRILNIETSTEICSVSVSESGKCVAYRESGADRSHSTILGSFIKDVFEELEYGPREIDAVAISSGPGSYTGLRIGVSTAKGLCLGATIPLIAVDTLKIMTLAAMQNFSSIDNDTLIIPMIDAKRQEVYTAVFNEQFDKISTTQALILEKNSFEKYTGKNLIICGNGAEKARKILNSENTTYIDNIYPSAQIMGNFSEIAYNKSDFVDVIWFEPFYLKDFIATTPKNKVLNFNKNKND